jgi:excisionase family DNA binding protein
MDQQLLLTIAQCCRLAAIGRTTFYALVANGEIPIRKIGTKTVVAASDLRDWVERLPAIKTKGGGQRFSRRVGAMKPQAGTPSTAGPNTKMV